MDYRSKRMSLFLVQNNKVHVMEKLVMYLQKFLQQNKLIFIPFSMSFFKHSSPPRHITENKLCLASWCSWRTQLKAGDHRLRGSHIPHHTGYPEGWRITLHTCNSVGPAKVARSYLSRGYPPHFMKSSLRMTLGGSFPVLSASPNKCFFFIWFKMKIHVVQHSGSSTLL